MRIFVFPHESVAKIIFPESPIATCLKHGILINSDDSVHRLGAFPEP